MPVSVNQHLPELSETERRVEDKKTVSKVVIVDDVITTGKSTIEAIKRSQEAGLDIVRIIALVDRQEGGRENIEALGFRVDAVVTREEVMEPYRIRHR